MAHNYEYRFEIKPGKFVFVPTKLGAKRGKKITSDLLKRWQPADYFYHLGKRGGHVAAMRPHSRHKFMGSLDLSGFFTSVSRTKVHRSLKSVGYANRYALDIATESCVEQFGRKFIPYGFTQSMALATLVVETSALGTGIARLRRQGLAITMYVDDIILSSDCFEQAQLAYYELCACTVQARFKISNEKSSPPAENVSAFNCDISKGILRVEDARMERFKEDLMDASEPAKLAILKYVGVINSSQRDQLIKLL